MVRRSTPHYILDNRAFPIRVLIADRSGLGGPALRITEARAWAAENIGRGNFACHGQGTMKLHAFGFYFRSIEDAARFLEAHPHLELLDTTDRVEHLISARKAADWKPDLMGFSTPGTLNQGFKS